ncbi:hypothetical protein [Actinomadura fibrosa]|uniref:Integral membrane protein n=1 Tax=Actinomadura fibrosa TaxID=111802 RepID=A0ABW2XX45_9ACTN|nr:hypothetical protein [Actinomadura fibrosa]
MSDVDRRPDGASDTEAHDLSEVGAEVPKAASDVPKAGANVPDVPKTGADVPRAAPDAPKVGANEAEPAADPDPDAAASGSGSDGEELRRLRAEVAALRAELTARRGAPVRPLLPGLRRALAAVLVALAGFGLVASVVGVWGARTTLKTDRWVATVAPLPEHPEVNAAMATYLTDQVFANLDVQRRLTDALPPKAAFLAGPVSGAVQDYFRERVQKFMGTPQFAALWEQANRFAHAQLTAIVEGKSETVTVQDGTVTLNLLPIVNDVLVTVSNELPTLFGKQLQLPTLSSGQIPPDLRERIQTALGVTLPADFAQITVYHDADLSGFQHAVVLFKRGLVLLVLGTLLCLGLALAVSPGRRRTLLQFGVAVAVSTVALEAVLHAVRDRMLERVPDGLYRQAASVAVHEIFTTPRERGDQLLWCGIAVAVLAYLAGPGRLPVLLRRSAVRGARATASGARSAATSERLAEQAARHLDPLRVAGVVLAAVAALLVASWTAFLVILAVLAAYEAAVTLLARRGPAAPVPSGRAG